MDLKPRFALERANSGEQRIHKIIQLIRESAFGIHDLSRCKASKKGEFYRMNMPLELGYDLGARAFGGKKFASKKVLILEEEQYTIQKAASDLAGCDCAFHANDPKKVVRVVRNWLVQEAGGSSKIAANSIWESFNYFMGWIYDDLKAKNWSADDIALIEINELKDRMDGWLRSNPIKE